MKPNLRIALLLATVAVPFAAANAADYDPPIYVEDTPTVPVEIGSGWYLRGDVGYSVSAEIGGVTYRTFDSLSSTYGSAAFATQSIEENVIWGGGVGYQFNEWVRADVTVDGFRTAFDGTTVSPLPCVDPLVDPNFAGTTCRSEDGSRVSAISLMANGYVDLGTFVGVTPYLGAGVGYSYVRWDALSSNNFCVDGIGACPLPGGVVSSAWHGGEKGWRFTYALMAGFAYDISNNFKLDFGYKYRHINGGSMFQWDGATAAVGASGTQGTHGDIDQHEFKVGLRYEIW